MNEALELLQILEAFRLLHEKRGLAIDNDMVIKCCQSYIAQYFKVPSFEYWQDQIQKDMNKSGSIQVLQDQLDKCSSKHSSDKIYIVIMDWAYEGDCGMEILLTTKNEETACKIFKEKVESEKLDSWIADPTALIIHETDRVFLAYLKYESYLNVHTHIRILVETLE